MLPLMVLWSAMPWRLIIDNLEHTVRPPTPAPANVPSKVEPTPRRETLQPIQPRANSPVQLGQDLVLHVMDHGRVSFARCFRKAIERDPLVSSFKVRLHVELDSVGNITALTTDAEDEALATCLTRTVQGLPFPGVSQPTVVDLPILFRQ